MINGANKGLKVVEETKICFKCGGKPQPLSNFYKHPDTLDGRLNKCKTCTKKDVSSNYRKNIEHYQNYDRTRQQSPERKAAKAQYLKDFRAKHPEFSKAHCAKRRAVKKQAMPDWVDFGELKRIYASCPEGFEVDHEIPLQNPDVCGLHVPWNLQYLTELDNAKKGNAFSLSNWGNLK